MSLSARPGGGYGQLRPIVTRPREAGRPCPGTVRCTARRRASRSPVSLPDRGDVRGPDDLAAGFLDGGLGGADARGATPAIAPEVALAVGAPGVLGDVDRRDVRL